MSGASSETQGDETKVLISEDEHNILKRQIDDYTAKTNYLTLYRYASRVDLAIIFSSVIAALAAGAAVPLMTVVLGHLTVSLKDYEINRISRAEFHHDMGTYSLYFVYLAIGEFVTVYIATAGFLCVGDNLARRTREEYLKAILRQNIGFLDNLGAGEITTRVTTDMQLIQAAISEKIPTCLTSISTFVTAMIVAYISSWKLALISSATVVAIVLLMGGVSRFMVKFSRQSSESNTHAATVAEEVLSSMRIVMAFNAQKKLSDQFNQHIGEAAKSGIKARMLLGFSIGGLICIVMLNIGLDFWMGSRFLVHEEISQGDILTITLSIILGAFSLGYVAPNAQAIASGVAAGTKIFSTIDRNPPINSSSQEGLKLHKIDGDVYFDRIRHIYPSREEVLVLKDVSLHIPAGKITALVGASGSGKSTFVNLLERFYEPVEGRITLDGHDIKALNLQWLRQQISLVSQEPILFRTSIYENIQYGLIGSIYEEAPEEKKRDLVIQAAKIANAHDFISALPKGYETYVGERGSLMSGGQKQRIAMARAIIKDPKILLLDEATSAQDTKSERLIQNALDSAAVGRTTMIIAHRLSTIKKADNIVVMDQGQIVEQGTHDQLYLLKGYYFNLLQAQEISSGLGNGEDEIDFADNTTIQAPTNASTLWEDDLDEICQHREIKIHDLESLANKLDEDLEELNKQDIQDIRPPEQKYTTWALLKVVARFNRPEARWMILGLICSVFAGSGTPTHVVFFAKSVSALAEPPYKYGQLRSDINFWSSMYLMLGFIMLITYGVHGYSFALCSEKLLYRARERAFRAIIQQDAAFFDREENSTGALTSFLFTQTMNLTGMSGATLGTVLTVTTTLVAAISISIAFGWKLGLVCTAMVPVLLGCGFLRFYLLVKFESDSKEAYEQSASHACEATSAIRTVASLTLEHHVWREYHQQLLAQGKKNIRSALSSSVLYALSQSLFFCCTALSFWYGGLLIERKEYSLLQLFVCFIEIMFGTQSVGTIFSFAPDMAKAKDAAHHLKVLFDEKPKIEIQGGQPISSVQGTIEFTDVSFSYPTRPGTSILKNVSLKVQPGQHVALVGSSGCGKSTIISLLERYYQPTSGKIYMDGIDISTLDVQQYRSFLGLVNQEPSLFQGTIRENILLGVDPNGDISDQEIEQACRDANIYDFIMSMPNVWETIVGNKGTMLSGGQKQRLAIARALLRRPRVLLLDEATSALDSESEAIVQEALDAAVKGRTTISIAHRLSSIQNADWIYVFAPGGIIEQGTHQALMQSRGAYYDLVLLQNLGKAS